MGFSDEADQDLNQRFQDVCADLNMDKNASEEAWQAYKQISTNYTLEGDKLHWLACALYVACRKSVVPTVSSPNFIEGNCVSLTRLLRSSKLSIIQFFKLMKKWYDMANLPPDLRNKVDHLERNFAVSTVIFKKFEPIYVDIFKDPLSDPPRVPRSRKQKRLPCSSSELFSLCWTMFVKVKAHFTQISDDLVNSYHLLLSIMDLFYNNVIIADRRDIINLAFPGLPDDFNDAGYIPPKEPPCIIRKLCERHEGLVIEAKSIKEHWCKPHVKKLFEKMVLKGNISELSGLIDIGNFEANSKALNKQYEEYVLSVGDFDERIFLGYDAKDEIGTSKQPCPGELSKEIQAKRNLREHFEMTKSLSLQTPLTGKRYLEEKESLNVTPVSTATQSVNRLQTMLSGCKTSPSDELIKIFKSCSRDPSENINSLVKEMGNKFCSSYAAPFDEHPAFRFSIDFARKRLQLGECLMYKILEKVVVLEKNLHPNMDMTQLLEQTIFHRSLFACCIEIVLFSYNSQRTFPWIIDIFDIRPYYFYRVIEVLIRAEDGLSRDVVKNLNHIEEQILESLSWKSESPLWESVRNFGQTLPSFEEVSLPSQLENSQLSNCSTQSPLLSPVAHPAVRRITSIDRSTNKRDGSTSPFMPCLSNVTTPTSDTFQSPPAGTPTSAKRRLFTTGPVSGSTVMVTGSLQSPASGNSTSLQGSGRTVSITLQTVQGENGVTYLPISSNALQTAFANATSSTVEKSKSTSPPVVPNKPKKTGSLALFLRKVYHLASVRLRDLCNKLDLNNEDLQKKIWTCFEYCVMHHTDLMMDRHLDQLLMCSIYVMAKVTENDRSFQDIMKCYRTQPQCASHVYRAVLLKSRRRQTSGSSENSRNGTSGSGSNSPISSERDDDKDLNKDTNRIRSSSTLPVLNTGSQPPTPTRMAGTGTSFEFEDRGDLIKFYNQVYIVKVQAFATKFLTAKNNAVDSPPLSPMPRLKANPMSPWRRVSNKHSVFISPLKSTNMNSSPTKQLSYSFSRSPAKDLRAINNMVRLGERRNVSNGAGFKRVLSIDDNASDIPTKLNQSVVSLRKIQSVFNERRSGVSE